LFSDLRPHARTLPPGRYHKHALRGVAFHRTYPLFASASDDATVHVFHGMVYADLLTNPLIVPVKVLRCASGSLPRLLPFQKCFLP
jgi:hypothetical protein